MKKALGITLIATGFLTLILIFTRSIPKIEYWMASPKNKLARAISNDLMNLEKHHQLPPAWQEIQIVQIKGANEPASSWVEDLKLPIKTSRSGHYVLKVFVIHWIEDKSYGAVVEYGLYDSKSGNKTDEFARTLKLGFLI